MSQSQTKTYTFHIHGMHCQSCVLVTESELNDLPNVKKARSSLKTHTLEIEGVFGDKTPEQIAEELSVPLRPHGYTVSLEQQVKSKSWHEFKIAIPIAAGFALLFVALQKMGIVNLVSASSVSYGTAFVVGIIASLSTCMAVVGGLVLSMSATFVKGGDKVRPQLLFHIGRLVSFFVLGGVIGAIGSMFQLGAYGNFAVGIVIGLVMLILGLNLLGIFHWSKRLTPSMPKFISKHALGASKLNHSRPTERFQSFGRALTPLLVGVLTFFLPCGFTQSMQVYTLGIGSFLGGALTMLSFALGTLPVLALVSFSSFSIRDSAKSGIFFKSAGLIVIMFALFNLLNSLAVIGLFPPLFSF